MHAIQNKASGFDSIADLLFYIIYNFLVSVSLYHFISTITCQQPLHIMTQTALQMCYVQAGKTTLGTHKDRSAYIC